MTPDQEKEAVRQFMDWLKDEDLVLYVDTNIGSRRVIQPNNEKGDHVIARYFATRGMR